MQKGLWAKASLPYGRYTNYNPDSAETNVCFIETAPIPGLLPSQRLAHTSYILIMHHHPGRKKNTVDEDSEKGVIYDNR